MTLIIRSQLYCGKLIKNNICKNIKLCSRSVLNLLNYSKDEEKKILDVINQSDNELIKYNISKSRIKKIEAWKSKYGQFQTIEQFLEIEGFENKIIDRFCKSILNGGDDEKLTKKLNRRHHGAFCTPNITDKNRLSYKTCISIHIGVSSITWTKLQLNYSSTIEVKEWKYYDITDKKLQLQDLIKKCLEIDSLIPNADCYVLENLQAIQTSQLPGNTEQIKTNVQKAQLFAVLSFGLMKRNISNNDNNDSCFTLCSEKPNLFYLRRFLASRLFNLFIGTEKISSEQVILNLMRIHYNVKDTLNDDGISKQIPTSPSPLNGKVNVVFSSKMYDVYEKSEGYQREFLGQSLLIGLAFVKLCLLKCSNSLKIMGDNIKVVNK